MTLLQHIQEFCGRTNITVPTSVFGTSDTQVLQAMRLLEEGCIALSQRGAWERLTYEYTFSTLAAEDQGSINGAGLGTGAVALNGYRYLLPETLWDRTQKIPLLGPTNSRTWQMYKAIVLTGPVYSFRLRGGKFLVTPAPPVAHTWAFEYVSKNWLEISAGSGTYSNRFTADANSVLLPEDVVTQDLRWRWKKEKGLSYEEDFNTLEAMVVDYIGREPHSVVSMDDCGGFEPKPGIWVPSGSWRVP